ncbi:MAG: Gfo/Idh/MocA family protein [Gammaproteobacteria bacterium]
MADRLRVLIVGLGNMGHSHARAYQRLDTSVELVGLCSRSIENQCDIPAALGALPRFADYAEALSSLAPDAVCICTWPDTHAEYALAAFEAGAHVFVEKPMAETVDAARQVADEARATGRKLVVGYILRHHPAWSRFVEVAHTLGKPLVMRMNLNQQSSGASWEVHKHLMRSLSPIVDCGVHYVDVMCLMTRSRPVRVHAVGARLSDEIDEQMYNYGHLHVTFDDGSVGWYEAGWGPMMSETAFFVKDVIGPRGSASIVMQDHDSAPRRNQVNSDNMSVHTRTNAIRVHHAKTSASGDFALADDLLSMADEPDHDALCTAEQRYFVRAIEEDLDLEQHVADAINSLRIVLAADEAVRTGEVVAL